MPLYDKLKSFYVKIKIQLDGIRKLQAFITQLPDTVTTCFEAYGGAINALPQNATAFVHRGTTMFSAVVTYKSFNPNVTANATGAAAVNNFFELGKAIFSHRESYQNYLDGDLRDYLRRYYATYLQRLVQIKEKYDPANYFHFLQLITTKILF